MDINDHIAKIYQEGDLLLGSILSFLPKGPSNLVSTAAIVLDKETDGLSLTWSEEFFSELTSLEIRAVLRHEAMHVAFSHIPRMGTKNPRRWNIATDMFINQNVQNLPEGGVTLPEGWPRNASADEYYKKLEENPEVEEEYADNGTIDDHDGWEEIADNEQAMGEIDNVVKDLAERAQKAGDKMGASAISATPRKPSRQWASDIRRMFEPTTREVQYKSNRFDRRRTYHNGQEMIPARLNKPHCPKIYVAVDTSGSVSPEMVQKFSSEVNNMARYAEVECIVFDHDIHERFQWKKDVPVSMTGGGGTSFQPVFDIVCEDKDCAGVVVLTDGYAEKPVLSRNVKTLWVCTKHYNAELKNWFGKVTELSF